MKADTQAVPKKKNRKLLQIAKTWQLYILLFPTILYFVVFHYFPMYGVQIAFKDFVAFKGITGSEWVGFKHFARFFNSYSFWGLMKNTLLLNLYDLLITFPIPIIFALMLNQVPKERFKKLVQTITYAPHFISVVVLIGMLSLFLSPQSGAINNLIELFGGKPIHFLGEAGWFRTLFIASGVWQTTGFSAIIYLAALTSIDPEQHEAAIVDGANKFQRIRFIDLPGILPVIMILLILQIGNFMTVGFQKILLMQNSLNISTSEVIQTYVYKTGLLDAQFSYSAAIGLFNNVINFALLLTVNYVAKKMKQETLF